MSRKFGSTGNESSREHDHKQMASRRRKSLASFGDRRSLVAGVAPIVQKLEDRVLLTGGPTLSISGTSTFTTSPVAIIPAISITDPTFNITSATITLNSPPDGSAETLSGASAPTDVTYSFNAAHTSVTLAAISGSGITPSAMELDLEAFNYQDAATTNRSSGLRSYTVTATDNQTPTAQVGTTTTTTTLNVSVAPPVLTIVGTNSPFNGTGAVPVIPSGSTLTAGDNIASATITLNAPPDSSFETFTNVSSFPGGITASQSTTGGNLVLTLVAPAGGVSAGTFLTALKQVNYNDTKAIPTGSSRSFAINVTDAAAVGPQSGSANSTINFVANQPPVITAPSSTPSFLENATEPFTGSNAITISDPNATDSLTLSVLRGTLSITSPALSGPTLTLTGSPSTINTELATLTYKANPGSSQDSLGQPQTDTLSLNDTQLTFIGTGGPLSASKSVTLNVQPVVNLSVIVTTPTSTIQTGNAVSYVIQVTNNGPDTATNVSIANAITLAGTTGNFTLSGPTLTSSSHSGQAITSTGSASSIGFQFAQHVLAGETSLISFTVTPLAKGTLTSAASYSLSPETSGGLLVSNPQNVSVVDNGVLSISNTQTSFPILSGSGSTTYTINLNRTTFNNEASDGTVTANLTVTLPPGSTAYGTSPGNFTISYNGSVIPASTPTTISFDPSSSSSVVPLTLTVYNVSGSSVLTPNEPFTLTLSSPTGGATLDPSRTVVNETLTNTNSLVVTTTADSGPGSLRQILATAALISPAGSLVPIPIDFNIPPSTTNQNTFVIQLLTPLTISSPVVIVGGSQLGSTPPIPPIVIEPSTGNTLNGITFASGSDGSTLEGVRVTGFTGFGVDLVANRVTVQSSLIDSNSGDGIESSGNAETIGGLNATLGNTISGNTGPAVLISGSLSGTQVSYNAITTTSSPGVSVSGSSGVIVGNNTIGGSTTVGLSFVNSSGSMISSNNITGSAGIGIQLQGDSGDDLVNNIITGTLSGIEGIKVTGSTSPTISGSSISGALGIGIGIGASTSGARIIGGTVNDSTIGAILVGSGSNNSVTGTTIAVQKGDGIDVSGSNDTISGVTINPRAGGTLIDGVHLESGSSGNSVSGTIGGTTTAGILLSGNTGDTISASVTTTTGTGIQDTDGSGNQFEGVIIGGSSLTNGILLDGSTSNDTISGGTITGSKTAGISVGSSGNTSISGTKIAPSGGSGISVNGGSTTTVTSVTIQGTANVGAGVLLENSTSSNLAKNSISGNLDGVVVMGALTSGLSLTSNQIISNSEYGVHLMPGVTGGTIGGGSVGNEISGNGDYGIFLDGASQFMIQGNEIGTNPAGTEALGNGARLPNNTGAGIYITGAGSSQNTIGGDLLADANVISGNSGSGILIQGPDSTGELIQGNYLGTDGKGGRSLGTQTAGIHLLATNGETIVSNVISGNLAIGLYLDGSTGNTITSNKIGTTGNGSGVVGNGIGVEINDPGTGTNTIGGVNAGNTISGNGYAGILMQGVINQPQMIEGNDIGTDSAGSNGLESQLYGVLFQDVTGGTIGNLGSGNVISGNSTYGVYLLGSSNVAVIGNLIGSNASASGVVPNGTAGGSGAGLEITGDAINPANNNTIGGSVAGSGNVISGNTGSGISILGPTANNQVIQANYIGTNLGMASGLGNMGDGILISHSGGDLILQNTIGGNAFNGIEANASQGLIVQGNGIGIGIGLSQAAPLPNNLDGLLITGSSLSDSGDSLTMNQIEHNVGAGIKFSGAVFATLTGDTIGDNSGDGVLVTGQLQEHPSIAISDVITGNVTNGLELQGAVSYTVNLSGSMISANKGDGILLDEGSSMNTLMGGSQTPMIMGNFDNGVEIRSTGDVDQNNVIEYLESTSNNNNGILITGSNASSNILTQNTVESNFNDGISIQSAGAKNQVTSSTISKNVNDGISVSSNTPGTFLGLQDQGNHVSLNHNYGISIDNSNDSSVFGNVVEGNLSNGVVISNAGSTGNFLIANTIDQNSLAGVLISAAANNFITNTPLGGTPFQGNTIYANKTDGVEIYGANSNTVAGNFIGTDQINDVSLAIAGAPAPLILGNLGDGIHLINSSFNNIGGLDASLGNVISANKGSGVEIFGFSSSNIILNNVIGTKTSITSLGNKLNGVFVSGSVISDPDGQTDPMNNRVVNNTISGNQQNGVAISLADQNFVYGNAIGGTMSTDGTTGQGLIPQDLPNSLSGVSISSANGNTIGLPGQGNAIAGNLVDGISLLTTTGDSIVGNFVEYNTVDGINLDHNYRASITGNTVRGNLADGVRVQDGSTKASVGVAGQAANLIYGNAGAGVEISTQATANSIAANQIGYDGTAAIGNLAGVYLNQVAGNTVGGGTVASANTVMGNINYGVFIAGNPSNSSAGNTVSINYIGTGSNPLNQVFSSNPTASDVGVYVLNSANNLIVGNVASGNHLAGIELFGSLSTGDVVLNNLIGANASGTAPVMTNPAAGVNFYQNLAVVNSNNTTTSIRQNYGVWLNGSAGNSVTGDVIQGNHVGIQIEGSPNGNTAINTITSNTIGSTSPYTNYQSGNYDGLGNLYGIYIDNSSNNMITGGNLIDQNISVGVAIVGAGADANIVKGNTIDSNGGYASPTTDSTLVGLAKYTKGDKVYGSGVFINAGHANVIDSNRVEGNVQVNVYIYNFGPQTPTTASQSTSVNQVTNNTINGLNSLDKNPILATEYGLLLFNSDGNLPGVTGSSHPNKYVVNDRYANFFPFDGAAFLDNEIVNNTPLPTTQTVKIGSVPTNGVPVTILAVGKGHPLPTALKKLARGG